MCKIRNPLDALKNPKESFQHPLKALPIETESGALGPLGANKGGAAESTLVAPTAAPPVTASAQEVVQAGIDLRQQELRKKSIKKTTVAGETGGWMGSKPGKMPGAAYGMPGAPTVRAP